MCVQFTLHNNGQFLGHLETNYSASVKCTPASQLINNTNLAPPLWPEWLIEGDHPGNCIIIILLVPLTSHDLPLPLAHAACGIGS